MMNSLLPTIAPTLPPALIMMLGGLLLPFFHRYVRNVFVLLLPVVTLWQVWSIPVGEVLLRADIGGMNLTPLYAHPYTHIFATAFCLAALMGGLYGLAQSKASEMAAAFVYAGSAIGITFSGDLVSMFLFWEMMAIGSTLVVFASDHPASMRAGVRYATMHFLGGIILLTGIIAHLLLDGSMEMLPFDAPMEVLFPDYTLDLNGMVIWMVLVGILVNVAMPPLSAWLPDAYAKSSPFGGVFLSCFTTKAAIFVLMTLFPGTEILFYVGIAMVAYGIFYAALENDMRAMLSYSLISQLGVLVMGISMGTELALSGVAANAFAGIIYQGLLFMVAGSVLYMSRTSKCTELGGLSRSMKVTTACAIVGAMSVAAMPLTTGFATKSLIAAAAGNDELFYEWLLLIFASAGVVLHAGLRFPWLVFFHKDSGQRPHDPPLNMVLAMVCAALLCVIPAWPGLMELTLYRLLPALPDVEVYSASHIVSQMQLLGCAALAFFMLRPLIAAKDTITLDFDWFYRGLGRYVYLMLVLMGQFPWRIIKLLIRMVLRKIHGAVYLLHHPQGIIARRKTLGATMVWLMAFLGVYMGLYFF